MALTPVQGAQIPPSAPTVQAPAQPQVCSTCPSVESTATNAVKIVINEPKVIAKTSPQPIQPKCNCDTCTKSFIA